MRFIQPTPLLFGNIHHNIATSAGSRLIDNHFHHSNWANTLNSTNNISRGYHLTEDNSGDDNSTINTVCITPGGDAVSFSKHNANESRRSSAQSNSGYTTLHQSHIEKTQENCGNGNIGEGVGWCDTNLNQHTRSPIENLGHNLPRRPSNQLSGEFGDEDLETTSIEENSCMDDDNTSISSPSISSSVADSSEVINCRGIINPNYPGFQHLAHTLSEHFFDDHHFAQSSEDSDLSEFEVETDRSEFSHSNNIPRPINNCNNNNNINNSDTLKKIEDLIRGAFHSRESEPPVYADPISSGYSRIMENYSENAVDAQVFHVYSVLESHETPFQTSDAMLGLTKINQKAQHDNDKRSTPDILRKTTKKGEHLDGKSQPDILQNVIVDGGDQDVEDILVEKALEWIYIGKEGSLEEVGDIVGDFEQEVQHELGLIVSGYSMEPVKEAMDLDVLQVQQETLACLISNADKMERLLQKMADAVLSDGSELLVQTCSSDASDNTIADAHCPNERSSTIINSDQPFQLEQPPENDAALIKEVDDQNDSKNFLIRRDSRAAYHRRSHDDRQLSPVVCIDREIPWYQNSVTSSSLLINNNHSLTYEAIIKDNNNAMLSPSSSTKSWVTSSVSASPYGKKINQTSASIEQQQRRYSKNASFSGREMTSPTGVEERTDATPVNICETVNIYVAENGFGRDPSNAPSLDAGKAESVSNNNACSKHIDVKNRVSEKAADLTQKTANVTSASYRKFSNIKKRTNRNLRDSSGNFDVCNIETSMPKIDLDAIETQLKAAKEEERRKRNDRKEILRRLALGSEFDPNARADKPMRKPSLHSRLQGGMNLQICFMNDTASDTESPSSDSESCPKLSKSQTFNNRPQYNSATAHPYKSHPLSVNIERRSAAQEHFRPTSLHFVTDSPDGTDGVESDFFTKQARLQIEARMALAQAKDIAHMQMEMERQKQKDSPITEIIRNSLEKVGIDFPPEKRRVSRQMLTDMNIAQLQVIVNDLHTQIERLNERLVQYLMERDELHMSQDSMLVDIEDLTRYLGAKEQTNEKPASDKNTILLMSQQQQPPEKNSASSRYASHLTSK